MRAILVAVGLLSIVAIAALGGLGEARRDPQPASCFPDCGLDSCFPDCLPQLSRAIALCWPDCLPNR